MLETGEIYTIKKFSNLCTLSFSHISRRVLMLRAPGHVIDHYYGGWKLIDIRFIIHEPKYIYMNLNKKIKNKKFENQGRPWPPLVYMEFDPSRTNMIPRFDFDTLDLKVLNGNHLQI
jgi:hypothetical protein